VKKSVIPENGAHYGFNFATAKNRQVTFATSAVELDSESGGTTGAVSSSTHGQDNSFYHGRASEIFLSFVLSLFLENQVAIFGLVLLFLSVAFCISAGDIISSRDIVLFLASLMLHAYVISGQVFLLSGHVGPLHLQRIKHSYSICACGVLHDLQLAEMPTRCPVLQKMIRPTNTKQWMSN